MVEITANKYTRVITLNQSCNVQFALQPLSQTATGRIEIQARRFKDGVFIGNLDRSNRILYGLFDNIAVDAMHVLDGETLQLWGIYRGIPPFEAVILNASIVNLEVTEPEPEEEEVARILRKDNLWSTAWFPYFGSLRWITEYIKDGGGNWINASGLVGSLDYGYFIAGSKMHLAVCGGGASRGESKIITVRDEGNTILVSKTLNEIAPRDAGEPHPAIIETPGLSGQKIYLRFDDQDASSAGWSWMGVNLSSIVIED
ncbi:hypothetical protein VB712_04790 [Spirulina sp. CCNP1310]|uniref:hypothetical protein n=1 Tax=Spirulina sp. CCNP1310 TaxID=3110249 RepID=UPI002B20966E|nr:hypothetical protein [Spirulina sp. CCNP1310]MEA5418533.1 hypothetical protein [Spirulina sp. CCNP1310]